MGENTYLSDSVLLFHHVCVVSFLSLYFRLKLSTLFYIEDNVHTITLIRQYLKTTTDTLDSMLVSLTVLWHRAGCVFVIINCLSPNSVSCFKHIVLERCHTSGFCKLTSCFTVCDCGASFFM